MKKKLLSEYVKSLRQSSGLTINQFAKLHNLSHSQISKYESGELDNPSLLVISKFCLSFGMSAEDFSETIQYNSSLTKNKSGFIDSINQLMSSDDEVDAKKYIFDFFENSHEKYGLNTLSDSAFPIPIDLRAIYCDKRLFCYNRNNETVYIQSIKYTKKQKGKRMSYKNELEYSIALFFMYNAFTPCNILVLTPSKVCFDSFSNFKNRNEGLTNIILMYYKYRRESEYKVINGNDFILANKPI